MISKTVIISGEAKIGKNVKIGHFTTIYGNVVIEDNTDIGPYCELGVESPLAEGAPLYKDLPSDDPMQRKPDISLAREKLKWRPKFSWKKG